eukprot:TRINITY_DN55845_c0_g1_i1.p1 TRINITY_DN55845_c0_g1~~TRINITY_DN55845_c0_g1_i1.p1  ORF type:complete len:274 (-),score=31.66 TRINITY_DN55845_c0_g1_i1:39-860(-)
MCSILLSALYPLRGALYFLPRCRLWGMVACPILVSLVVTIASLIFFFARLLVPEVHFLQDYFDWPSWVSWPIGVLFGVAGVAVVNGIVFLILFGQVQSQILREVLEDVGIMDCLRREMGNIPKRAHEVCCCADVRENSICRDLGHTIQFLVARLVLMLVTLPLNSMPIAGQIAWIAANGWLYAWELTAEFMVMAFGKRSCSEQWGFVKQRFGFYMGFGMMAMALELVPFVGPIIFYGSNACGGALLCKHFFSKYYEDTGEGWERRPSLETRLL